MNIHLNPENWVNDHGDAMYSYAFKRLRQPELAQDLVQDALIAALKSSDRFKGASTERTWLISILKNKITDHLRKSFREVTGNEDTTVMEIFENQQFDSHERWNQAIQEWSDSPLYSVQSNEFWEIIKKCLNALPDSMSSVFMLREFDGISTDELSESLELSKSNIWTLLSRARLKMRDCLKDSYLSH